MSFLSACNIVTISSSWGSILTYYHGNSHSFCHNILVVYIEYIASIEFFKNNSSFYHHIIVSKNFLLQLIASIYHQSNSLDCSSVLSNQSSLTSIVTKSRRAWTRHIHVIEFVSLFISFVHLLLIIFSSFFHSFRITFTDWVFSS
jgi:hypothetical protein